MAHPRLRVYYGPEQEQDSAVLDSPTSEQATVTVPLGDILPLLADAMRFNLQWVRDFQDEEVTISADLHEVLLAYEHYQHHRPSA